MNKINLILWASFIILAWCMTNIEDTNNTQQTSTWNTQTTETTWNQSTTQESSSVSGSEVSESASTKTVVSTWDTVKVDYIGTFESGDVFDTNIEDIAKKSWLYNERRSYSPLEFKVWWWQMIKWFDEGVVWMKVWETKKIVLPPELAYWQPSEQNIIYVPKANLWTGEIEVWKDYSFNTPSWVVSWKILGFSWDQVQIDFNSPMAGKTLTFEITVREIK